MRRIRPRSVYDLLALVSFFLVFGGGTALASYVVSSNSQVAPNTISGHKPPSGDHPNMISGSLNATDLATGAVTRPKLANRSVSTSKFAAGATAPNANHATSAGSAARFGGLTPGQYVRAKTFSGFQPTATFNGSLTIATLTTSSIAPGAYLLIARLEPNQTGVSPSLAMHCNLTGPSGAGIDDASGGVIQSQGGEFTLVGTDTSTTPGSAVASCNVSGSHPFSLFAQVSVLRLGSEARNGTMTPG